ncbi:MAG: aspartate kinase [Cytophagales bacterium]|nr:MAG: aspartate kinase [Cytophagales bacterium]
MQVFKFGGASVKDADSVCNVGKIIEQFGSDGSLLVVISAMGKMTNAFEALLNTLWKSENYMSEWGRIRKYHLDIIYELFEEEQNAIEAEEILLALFNELESVFMSIEHNKNYDELYDKIIGYGELLSTRLVAYHLMQSGLDVVWIDARKVIVTDSSWRSANVDWDATQKRVGEELLNYLESGKIIITQGFIGANAEMSPTTLGREGSDYSAAIFANLLNAKKITIWKDVQGVLNTDPKIFPEAQLFAYLSYQEAAEMSYHGASVIHPKTIKPLQEKNIPLYVRSFLDTQKSGTCIDNTVSRKIIPSISFRRGMYLMMLESKSFGFLETQKILEILKGVFSDEVLFVHFNRMGLSIASEEKFSLSDDLLEQINFLGFELKELNDLLMIYVKNPDSNIEQVIRKRWRILSSQTDKYRMYFLAEPEEII